MLVLVQAPCPADTHLNFAASDGSGALVVARYSTCRGSLPPPLWHVQPMFIQCAPAFAEVLNYPYSREAARH